MGPLKKLGRATLVAGMALVFATQTAAAATPRVLATTSNPYASCTIGSGPPEWETVNYVNAEVEPYVAVNPANTRNIIGVVQQDRWNDGGAHGLVAMWSKDGGQSFHVVPLPFSSCAPGGLNYERASDPWVSIGPDGTAYTVSISFDENTTRGAIGAATSTDGGKTWGNLTELTTPDGFFDDKESVTADPTIPGTAYIVWDRTEYFGNGWPGPTWMSKTIDFGATWSDPEQITPTNSNTSDLGGIVVIDPNTGSLYVFFDRFYQQSGKVKYEVIKSTDGGNTWSDSVVIARDLGVQTVDPHPGGPDIRDGWEIISAAIDPNNGQLYAVWQDARFTNGQLNQILISTSMDGTSWSNPFLVSRTIGQAAFTGSVAVNAAGQVAVTYYDLRKYDPDKGGLPTNYWMRISAPGGTNFGPDIRLTDSFNILKAPDAGGRFLGDYQGLAARGNKFVTLYCATTRQANNPTDCYVSQVRP